MSLGTFTIIKNEVRWIGFHIMSVLPYVQRMVFFDGDSDDGTTELIFYLMEKYPEAKVKIRVHLHQDPKDLADDYVHVFNECLKSVDADYAWFLHPDMIIAEVDQMRVIPKNALACSVRMRNLGGDFGGPIFEFAEGRSKSWKTIMKNGLGLHYFGHYGAWNEDMYFRDITGDEHNYHHEFGQYPFDVHDSGIRLLHYSDVRSYERRLEKMVRVLETQRPNLTPEVRLAMAKDHPRVSLKPEGVFTGFLLKPFNAHPPVFQKYAAEFAIVLGCKPEDITPVPLEKEHA